MRASVLAVLALVFPLFAGAQEDARAALALVIGTAPPAKETTQPYTMSYESGYKLSKRSGMPLVVWVGLEPRQIGEGRLVNVGVKELEGYRAPCIVVAKWVDGRLMGKEVKSIAEAKDWLYPPVQRPQLRIAAPSGGC